MFLQHLLKLPAKTLADTFKSKSNRKFLLYFRAKSGGKNTKKRETFGHTAIISPDGKILKIKKKGIGIIYSVIDPNLPFKLRKIIPSSF